MTYLSKAAEISLSLSTRWELSKPKKGDIDLFKINYQIDIVDDTLSTNVKFNFN